MEGTRSDYAAVTGIVAGCRTPWFSAQSCSHFVDPTPMVFTGPDT